jgi:hypothetical protein
VDQKLGRMDFRKCPRKLVQESRLWFSYEVTTENNAPSSIVQTALLATWNKIETNETSQRKKLNYGIING